MRLDVTTLAATIPLPGVAVNSLYIGGVTLALCGTSPEEVRFDDALIPFVDNNRRADIVVSAEFVSDLGPPSGEPSFDSGAVWRSFPSAQGFTFDFISELLGASPYKRLIVDKNFSSARLLLNNTLLAHHAPIFPLEYPTDELLFTNYLAAQGLGVEVHGCGLIDFQLGGQLFLGHSGAGKSTTTRIWKASRNPLILSDDRIILRLNNANLRMYGTPWHGEAAFAEQGNTEIKRIFILEHGTRNRIRQLPKARAVGEVFARSFPPFHSGAGVQASLDFISRALDMVPCYELEFIPDSSAVEAVVDFHD